VIAEGISVRGLEEIVVGGRRRPADPRLARLATDRARLSELADRLGDRLETRVKVALGKSKGKVTIEFASLADLERIVR
jgi:ParB family chromosome partitioning protein